MRASVDDILSGECQITIEISDYRHEWAIDNGRARLTDADEFKVFCRDYDVPSASSIDGLAHCVLLEEVRGLLSAFASMSHSMAWIDHPRVRERFDNKIYQTAIARRHDLVAPDTMVTRRHGDATRFLSRGPTVVKQISPFGLVALESQEEGIYTSPVTAVPPEGAIAVCPTYLQRMVDKTSDVRITAIDEVMFGHEILPEKGERHIVDFRQRRVEIIRPFEIPAQTRSSVGRLMKAEGIRFACFDFGVAGDTLVFFEANIAGNWLWLEHATGAPISRAIGEAILRKPRT